MDQNTKPEPISAEEQEARAASLISILESAGLHRCPHSRDVAFCGCAPGRCAERGEVK